MDLDAELAMFAQEHQKRSGVKCRLCGLSNEIQAAIESGHERGVTTPVLSAFLKTKGFDVPEHTIGNHLRKSHAQR